MDALDTRCLDEEEILAFLSGEMNAEAVARLDAHVDGCASCRAVLARLADSTLVEARSNTTAATPRFAIVPPTPSDELGRGATVGRYVITRTLGAGGMGVVYAAYDPELDRRVALKLVRFFGSGREQSAADAAEARARLLREAQALARIEHENVIAIWDVGSFREQVFIAMELVDGWTLKTWLRERTRSLREVLDVMVRAGRGLAAAHEVGLVHRDFKPDNVLIGRDGRVRVSDFGLARTARERGDHDAAPTSVTSYRRWDALGEALTQTGTALGTPAYMPPEQHAGRPTDARSDQWSYCVTLYEAVYGMRPFVGDRLDLLAKAIFDGAVRPPPSGRGTRTVQRVIERGLAVDAGARFSSMSELLRILDRRERLGLRWVAGVGASFALVGGLAIGLGGSAPEAACEAAAAPAGRAWNAERKASVRRAFERVDTPFALDAWNNVEATLDRYVASWQRQMVAACEEGVTAGDDPIVRARAACLDRRLADAASLVGLFEKADAGVVEHAVAALGSLQDVSQCNDELLALVEPPAPPPAAIAAVAEVRERLAGVDALHAAGRYAEARAEAGHAVTAARATDYLPVVGEALLARAHVESRIDPRAAEAMARESVEIAIASRHDALAAEAWIALCNLVGAVEARFEEGVAIGRLANAAVDRLGTRPDLEAILAATTGQILVLAGRYGEGMERYRRAVAALEVAAGADDLALAPILDALAEAHFDRGELDEANALFGRARDIRARQLGTRHPEMGDSLRNLGAVEWARGRFEAAIERFEEARAIFVAASGTDSPDAEDMRLNIGVVLTDLGRPAEALAILEAGLPRAEARFGADHPELARILFNVGAARRHAGDPRRAEAELSRALGIWERAVGPDHVDVAMCLYELGELARRERRFEEAEERYRKSLPIVEASMGPDHRGVGFVLVGLGELALDRALPTDAVAPLERALALQGLDDLDDDRRARTEFALARALDARPDTRKRAVDLAVSARAHYARAGARSADALAKVESWLAQPGHAGSAGIP